MLNISMPFRTSGVYLTSSAAGTVAFAFGSGGFVTAYKERDQAVPPFIPALWILSFSNQLGQSQLLGCHIGVGTY